MNVIEAQPEVYQGQFGEFTINKSDRTGVIIYRSGLILAALSFVLGSGLILVQGTSPEILNAITPLFALFALGLGISLLTIHIYLAPLHRLLQLFWLIGTMATVVIAWQSHQPLAEVIYYYPLTLLGVGFLFVALTGIYFKEAFCFNRLETKILTPLVPCLLLGHLLGILPANGERSLLAVWALLFAVFALRKAIQSIPPDIGDKSVFTYLKQQRSLSVS